MFIFRRLWNFFKRPRVLITLGIMLLVLIVYYLGPLLRLQEAQRWPVALFVGGLALLAAIIVWTVQWFGQRRFMKEQKSQARESAARSGPDAQSDLAMLEKEFERAFDELARLKPGVNIFKGGSSGDLPWLTIIGPPGAGKSTALQASGLRFTSLGRRVRGIGGTRNCAWWLAEEAIFLDTAGRYSTQEEDHDEWLGFLRLIKKWRKQRPLDGAILQVGIDELINLGPTELEDIALRLRDRLDELIRELEVRFPVFLVFSKFDRIEGFHELFGGLLKKESTQPWGFTLDLGAIGSGAIGPLFEERYDALIESLSERVTPRLYELTTREAREAALAFPRELARHRESLQLFTEVLFEPSRHRERPWLTGVYFISATQEGHRVPGARQTVLAEWGLAGPPAQGVRSDAAYFVSGLFSNLVQQARDAALPSNQALRSMRRSRALTIAALMPLCAGCSWYLSDNYLRDSLWLKEVTSASQAMVTARSLGGSLDKIEREALFNELSREATVQDLLTSRDSEGLIRRVHDKASEMLRARMDDELLLPVEPVLNKRLEAGAEWRPGADETLFADGFLALKADYVLRQQLCEGANPEDTRTWMGQYVGGAWATGLGDKARDLLAGSTRTDLEQRVSWFFDGLQKSRAQLDDRRRDDALNALKGQSLEGQVSPEVIFNLIVANTDLTTLDPQIEGELLGDPGLKRVFTMSGCEKFLSSSNQGKEWWRCLLDISNPPALDRDATYLQKYVAAHYDWLNSLTIKKDLKDLGQVAQALGFLEQPQASELDQVMESMGSGTTSKRRSNKKASTYIPEVGGTLGWLKGCVTRTERYVQRTELLSAPQVCKQSADKFAPFGEAIKNDQNPGPIANAYKTYKTALRALRDRLQRIYKSANRNPEALTLVLDTMNSKAELYDAGMAREDFIGQLVNANPPINAESLNKLLSNMEMQTWALLLPPASKALQEEWTTRIFNAWSDIKYRSTRDTKSEAAACNRIKGFLNQQLEPFIQEKLALFYTGRNLRSCGLMEFLGTQMPLSGDVCYTVEGAIKVARTLECVEPTAGSGPTIGKPGTFEATGQECPNPLEEMEIDTSEEVYQCSVSKGQCFLLENRKTAGVARLVVRRKGQGSGLVWNKASNYAGLLAQGEKRGNRVVFPVLSDNCKTMSGIVYLVGGTEGQAGNQGDTRYKSVNLPGRIIR